MNYRALVIRAHVLSQVGLQGEYETFYCVVDLHAVTAPHDKKKLADETLSAAAVRAATAGLRQGIGWGKG